MISGRTLIGVTIQGRIQEFRNGGGGLHGERGARAYIGGLGTLPPVGSRGKAPGGGQGAKPTEASEKSAI
jgi:hypothetical protein